MSDQKPHVSPKEASQQQAMILDNQTSEAAISPAMNQNELAELIRANLGTETISTTAQKIGIRIYQKPYTVNKTEYEKDPITGKAKPLLKRLTVN